MYRVELDKKHHKVGGSHASGSTKKAWLNVTYNYAGHFKRVLGEDGIRVIYGLTGEESIPILKEAIGKLGSDVHVNYWEPTEGNAKKALENLLYFAERLRDRVWDGD